MKQLLKRAIVSLMLISILTSFLYVPISVRASSDDGDGKRYNIMLVIDGSGSLTSKTAGNTDPNGMRYELIGDLFGILEDDGHNVGAIVFSGSQKNGTSDEEMETGIMLNTGLLSLDELAPNGSKPKDYLEEKIKDIGVDNAKYGTTDIGTALLVAERELLAAQKKNGLESLVFLFTDGTTSVRGAVLEKSEQSRDTATLEMSRNGIRLFGAFLNNGGHIDSDEIPRIVCAANGISSTSEDFQNSYVEIQDAKSCHTAVNRFLKFLGYVHDDSYVIYYDDIEDTFVIPGVGVEEMNIRLYSANGEDLPDLDVKITQPDGQVINGVALRASRTFRVYKLTDPMPGTWKINITVPENNAVGYVYSPVVSLHIDADVDIVPDVSSLHVNMDADFTGLLVQNGTVLTDSAAYRGYDCTLEITNLGTGDVDSYEIQPNASDVFTQTVHLDTYGTFEARIVFSCGRIEVRSDPKTLDLLNHAPTHIGNQHPDVKYGLFQEETTELDLTAYFNDLEDGTNLSFRIKSATCSNSAIDLSGSVLTIQNKEIGDSTITVTGVDTQGSGVDMQIYVSATNATVGIVIAIIVLIILIIAGIIAKVIIDNSTPISGILQVSFDLEIDEKVQTISFELAAPGASAESRTNLGKLIQEVLRDDTTRIDKNLRAGDVKGAMDSALVKALAKVIVKKGVKKSGKKRVGVICVKYGKKKEILFNSAANLEVEDITFTLSYSLEEDDGFDFDDLTTNDSSKPQEGDDLLDELF